MDTYRFELVLDKPLTDADTNRLYEAGLDDCAIIVGGPGQPSEVWADRVATSYDKAVESVKADLSKCGFAAVKVTPSKPVKAGRPSLSKPGKRSPQLTIVIPTGIESAIERDAERLGIKKTQVARNILVGHYLKVDAVAPKARRKAKTRV